MPDRAFFDTNVFLYAILKPKDDAELEKKEISLDLIDNQDFNIVISVQVINEISNTLFKKTSLTPQDIQTTLTDILSIAEVIPLSSDLTLKGVDICHRYQFSFYDSLIISAALMSGCQYLLTEDLQDQQMIIDESRQLQVINPFNQQDSR